MEVVIGIAVLGLMLYGLFFILKFIYRIFFPKKIKITPYTPAPTPPPYIPKPFDLEEVLKYEDSTTGFPHYMVFDTETSGLPLDDEGDPKDADNWPRILQICWMILDSDFKKVKLCNYFIKVDFQIDPQVIKIHGITNEYLEENGVDIKPVLDEFLADMATTEILVAHNLEFDVPVVDAELLRIGEKRKLFRKRKVCTLKYGSGLCSKIGERRRYPSLPFICSLFLKGSEKDFKSHDARIDVKLTGKILKEIVEWDVLKEQWIRPKLVR